MASINVKTLFKGVGINLNDAQMEAIQSLIDSGSSADTSALFANAVYDSNTKKINFYNEDDDLLAYIDATAFVKDGMVDTVTVSNGYLVITFNTESGKQPISIPLTEIFDSASYYTKTDSDAKFATKTELAAKANAADLATVATSGSYNDLSNKPTVPTVPTNVSAFTNDAGYITQEEVIINEAFPSDWHKSGTMADLISDINADNAALVGKSYMSTVSFSDLPSGITQAELKVDIMSELPGSGKVLVFTVTSSDIDPYHWEYTSAYGESGTWRSWANSDEFNNYYTKTQVNTALSAKADASSLATVATSGSYNDLSNKPTIPAAQVNADWNASSGVAQILNKPTIPAAQVQSDWNQTSSSAVDFIKNKPTIPTVPTNVSAFTNDAGYLTQHQSLSNYYTKSEVNAELSDKQDTLTAGKNITIDANNVISTAGGDLSIDEITSNNVNEAIKATSNIVIKRGYDGQDLHDGDYYCLVYARINNNLVELPVTYLSNFIKAGIPVTVLNRIYVADIGVD